MKRALATLGILAVAAGHGGAPDRDRQVRGGRCWTSSARSSGGS